MRGGKRANAGRRKGTRNKSTQEIKQLLKKNVDFNIVVGKLFELVKGISVRRETQTGPVIYDQPPDAQAAKILLEYGFGKPPQPVEHETTESIEEFIKHLK